METAMLVALILAEAAVPVDGGGLARLHALHGWRLTRMAAPPATSIAAASPRRCRGTQAPPDGTIDADCIALMMRERSAVRAPRGTTPGAPPRAPAGTPGDGWRLASAMLPALQGLFGRGGMGVGFGSELALVRGARFTWHMAAPRDTRMAATMFAPETTVLARCGACWNEGEAAGAGLGAVRRAAAAAIEGVARGSGAPAN